MLGPVMQASCNATTSLVKSGPVSFCLSPADYPDSGSYRFNASTGVDDSAVMMVRYLRLRGLKRIALITATDAAGQVLDKSFAAAFAAPENKDAILTVHEHFNYADLSVAAQMARVKASNPQALIAWATGTPLATLLQAFRNAGLEIPFVGNSLVYEQALQLKSLMPKEFLFPGGPQALLTADLAALNSRDPVRRMQGVWGESFKAINVKPDFAQILVWDAAMLSVEILRRVGPNATPQQAHDYITNLHGWVGVNGVYDFRGRQRGVGAESIAMNRWDNEKDQIVAVSLGGGRPLK